jgi:protein-tyrosine phosphatase
MTLKSHLLKIYIHFQRSFDHMWRRYTGLPQVSKSEITPLLYLGGQYSDLGLSKLKKLGITGIVNMRTEAVHPQKLIPFAKLLHLPTLDNHAPSIEQLEEGVTFIQKELDMGGKVYIHCRLGEGRGPTMVIAYLISIGMTFQDAFASVKKVRIFINPTKVQIKRLKEFESFYKR